MFDQACFVQYGQFQVAKLDNIGSDMLFCVILVKWCKSSFLMSHIGLVLTVIMLLPLIIRLSTI